MSGASEPGVGPAPKQFVVMAANSPGAVLAADGRLLRTIGTTVPIKSATPANADGAACRVRNQVIRPLLVFLNPWVVGPLNIPVRRDVGTQPVREWTTTPTRSS